jgi:hypothetical protein
MLVSLGGAGVAAAQRVGEALGVGSCLNDVAAECEPVNDGGAEPWIGDGVGLAADGFVGGDGHGSFLLTLCENLEE